MKSITSITKILLIFIVTNVSFAQFDFYLPSENKKVIGYYFNDWVSENENEYTGKYVYCKTEWETTNYEGYIEIKDNNGIVSIALIESYDGGKPENAYEYIKIKNGETEFSNRNGTFRKLIYKDMNGIEKISYQLDIAGDCCDGACDKSFERVEIFSDNNGMGVREDFIFQILGKDISFNISEAQLLETYPNLTLQKSKDISNLHYYYYEEKAESDFDFLKLSFSFFENELYEIDIQNNFNELISTEIIDLTKSFNKDKEIENVIDPGYINIPTIIYRKGNLKITLTDVRFTFCRITNELIVQKLKDLHPNYFKNY